MSHEELGLVIYLFPFIPPPWLRVLFSLDCGEALKSTLQKVLSQHKTFTPQILTLTLQPCPWQADTQDNSLITVAIPILLQWWLDGMGTIHLAVAVKRNNSPAIMLHCRSCKTESCAWNSLQMIRPTRRLKNKMSFTWSGLSCWWYMWYSTKKRQNSSDVKMQKNEGMTSVEK